jgi:hypothetical protein
MYFCDPSARMQRSSETRGIEMSDNLSRAQTEQVTRLKQYADAEAQTNHVKKKRPGRPSKEVVEQEELHRIQLVLPPAVFARLSEVKRRTGATSFQEVIRSAVRVYDAITEELDNGSKVFVESDSSPPVRIQLCF